MLENHHFPSTFIFKWTVICLAYVGVYVDVFTICLTTPLSTYFSFLSSCLLCCTSVCLSIRLATHLPINNFILIDVRTQEDSILIFLRVFCFFFFWSFSFDKQLCWLKDFHATWHTFMIMLTKVEQQQLVWPHLSVYLSFLCLSVCLFLSLSLSLSLHITCRCKETVDKCVLYMA